MHRTKISSTLLFSCGLLVTGTALAGEPTYAHEGGHLMGLGHYPLTTMDGDVPNSGVTEQMIQDMMESNENFRAEGCKCQ